MCPTGVLRLKSIVAIPINRRSRSAPIITFIITCFFLMMSTFQLFDFLTISYKMVNIKQRFLMNWKTTTGSYSCKIAMVIIWHVYSCKIAMVIVWHVLSSKKCHVKITSVVTYAAGNQRWFGYTDILICIWKLKYQNRFFFFQYILSFLQFCLDGF